MFFNSIQGLRGVAALCVVLFHINEYSIIMGSNNNTYFNIFSRFSYGALLFFVISGFLMAYLIDVGYKNFLLRRILRIYPAFIVAVVAAVFLKVLIFGSIIEKNLFLSLTLLPFGEIQYPLAIEWTLIYEMFFYFICSVFTIRHLNRYFPSFLVIWLLIIVIAGVFFNIPTLQKPVISNIAFSAFNILFIMGCLSFYSIKAWRDLLRKHRYLLLITGLLMVVASCYVNSMLLKTSLCGLGFAIVIVCTTLLDEKIVKLKGFSLVKQFGDYSYALYLSHATIIAISFSVSQNMLGIPITTKVGLFSLISCLVVGWYFGKLDLALHKYTKSLNCRISTPRGMSLDVK